MNNWDRMGFALAVLWAFFTGYMIALSMGTTGMGWSDSSVTLWFPQNGMTGGMFVSLFRIAQWSCVILTFVLLLYILASLIGEAQ